MTTYYLDTCIWIDYWEERGSNGERACQLIKKVLLENSLVLYSDLHVEELKHRGYTIDKIHKIFSICKPHHLRHVHMTKQQVIEMQHIATQMHIPKGDVLHAILARDNHAQCVTHDSYFHRLRDITLAKTPRELL